MYQLLFWYTEKKHLLGIYSPPQILAIIICCPEIMKIEICKSTSRDMIEGPFPFTLHSLCMLLADFCTADIYASET